MASPRSNSSRGSRGSRASRGSIYTPPSPGSEKLNKCGEEIAEIQDRINKLEERKKYLIGQPKKMTVLLAERSRLRREVAQKHCSLRNEEAEREKRKQEASLNAAMVKMGLSEQPYSRHSITSGIGPMRRRKGSKRTKPYPQGGKKSTRISKRKRSRSKTRRTKKILM
jgi:hypothetical protein